MPVNEPRTGVPSRRAFLVLAAASCGIARPAKEQTETLPSEAKRYADPATEFTVFRLTDPAHRSLLTAPYNRGISNRNFLIFSSDRAGKLDAYRLDLRGGQWLKLTDAEALNPDSLLLLANDRGFCYIDGATLRTVDFTHYRRRDVYTAAAPFERLVAAVLSPESNSVYVAEQGRERTRVRLVSLGHGGANDLFETSDEIEALFPRPGGGIAYRSAAGVYFFDGHSSLRKLPLAPGRTASIFWSPGGGSLLYLNIPGKPGELNNIREFVLAAGQDRMLAKTTQFVQFAPNGDGSVFVGASGSMASPHILILLRSTRRELTLCEHRARDPRNLAVVFSPNSQRIMFQSDQHGKPALYAMPVERFVAATES
jgi:oligogalacturonide lyase